MREVLNTYTSLVHNLRHMEATILELLRHPEASEADVMLVVRKYGSAYSRVLDAYNKLYAKHPSNAYRLPHPSITSTVKEKRT